MTREKQILNELFVDVLKGQTFSQMTDKQLREYMEKSVRLAELEITDEKNTDENLKPYKV